MSEKAAVLVADNSMEKRSSELRAIEAVVPYQRQRYMTKLDIRLIPVLGVTYTLLFLDRTNSKSAIPCKQYHPDCGSRQCQNRGP
jgi:hypothetical protein